MPTTDKSHRAYRDALRADYGVTDVSFVGGGRTIHAVFDYRGKTIRLPVNQPGNHSGDHQIRADLRRALGKPPDEVTAPAPSPVVPVARPPAVAASAAGNAPTHQVRFMVSDAHAALVLEGAEYRALVVDRWAEPYRARIEILNPELFRVVPDPVGALLRREVNSRFYAVTDHGVKIARTTGDFGRSPALAEPNPDGSITVYCPIDTRVPLQRRRRRDVAPPPVDPRIPSGPDRCPGSLPAGGPVLVDVLQAIARVERETPYRLERAPDGAWQFVVPPVRLTPGDRR